MCGNTSERGEGGPEPRKSYLFFLTTVSRGIGLSGDTAHWSGKHLISEVSGAFGTSLENPRDRIIRTPRRTNIRIRSPR